MSPTQELIIPRPGTDYPTKDPIPGPSEAEFTSTFGTLLPPAQFLETKNGKVAYYSYDPSSTSATSNTPQGPSRVLFLHGVQTPALGLQPLTSRLHTHFPSAQIVLPDLYGHGLSSTPLVPHTLSLFHSLITALLDHLNWPSCHLLGYSLGGATCVSYAAANPRRVESLGLIAPAGLLKSSDFAAEHLRGDDEAAAKAYVLRYLEGGDLVVPAGWEERVNRGEVVAEKVREWQMRVHGGHTASVVAVFRDGGVLDGHASFLDVAGSGVRTIAVLGETDDVVTEEWLREVGVSNVVVVKGVGHGVVRQKVAEVAEAVGGFWKSLDEKTS